MNIRLFPDGTAYVSNQLIIPRRYEGTYYVLPLATDQVNLSSLQMLPQGNVITAQLASVRKGSLTFDGVLKSFTDQTAVITAQGTDLVIRDYDEIEKNNLLLVQLPQVLVGPMRLSYLTSPDMIVGLVIYRLNLSTGQLEAQLLVSNKTSMDIKGTTIDIVTTELLPMYRTLAFAESAAPAQSVSTLAGTVYQLEGTYNIPMNQLITVPLFNESIEHEVMYVFDAPRGRLNAMLMLSITPSSTLPSGILYIYDDVGLVSTSHMNSVGAGDTVALDLDRVADVYANGTVTVTPVNGTLKVEGEHVPQRVILAGTITNMLHEPITALVRYFVGDSLITNAASIQKEGNYALLAFEILANSTARYNMSFTQL